MYQYFSFPNYYWPENSFPDYYWPGTIVSADDLLHFTRNIYDMEGAYKVFDVGAIKDYNVTGTKVYNKKFKSYTVANPKEFTIK